MKSEYRALFIGLFLGVAITAPNAAADTLAFQSVITVKGAGGQSFAGQFDLSSRTEYAILSDTAFASATQGEGTYTDLVGPTFTVVDPSLPITLTLGSYQFAAGTPLNTAVSGTFSLFYTLYSVDPNSGGFDPIADYISNDQISRSNETFVDLQSNAGPPLQAPAPEASSWALAGLGLLVVSCSLRRKRA